MALPNPPWTHGQMYTDPVTGVNWIYDSSVNAWTRSYTALPAQGAIAVSAAFSGNGSAGAPLNLNARGVTNAHLAPGAAKSVKVTNAAGTDVEDMTLADVLVALGVPNHYNSAQDLSISDVPTHFDTVTVGGYATAGDGGHASWRRMSAAPSPVEMWHRQSSDGAWWMLMWEGVVRPRQLGAKADSTTNDWAAIDAAIRFASGRVNTSAAIVELEGLVYATNTTINVPVNVILRNGRVNALAGVWSDTNAVIEVTGHSAGLDRVYVDGNRQATVGIRLRNGGFVAAEYCRVYRCSSKQIAVEAGATVRGCVVAQWHSSDAEQSDPVQRTARGISIEADEANVVDNIAHFCLYPIYAAPDTVNALITGNHTYNGINGIAAGLWAPVNIRLDGSHLSNVVNNFIEDGRVLASARPGYKFEHSFVGNTSSYTASRGDQTAWIEFDAVDEANMNLNAVNIGANLWAAGLRVVRLATSGAGTWETSAAALNHNRDVVLSSRLTVVKTDDAGSNVAQFHSSAADGQAYIEAKSPATTNAFGAQYGVDINEAVVRTGGVERLRVHDNPTNDFDTVATIESPSSNDRAFISFKTPNAATALGAEFGAELDAAVVRTGGVERLRVNHASNSSEVATITSYASGGKGFLEFRGVNTTDAIGPQVGVEDNMLALRTAGVERFRVVEAGARFRQLSVATILAFTGVVPGTFAYASDGRKGGEGVGAGTGVLAYYDQTNTWIAADSGTPLAA